MNIFFVTVLHSTDGRRRCWGWYQRFEDAETAVLENHTDIFEMGYYDLAVIEEYPEGVLALPEDNRYWYKAVYRPVERDCLVEHTVEPPQYEQFACFAIG